MSSKNLLRALALVLPGGALGASCVLAAAASQSSQDAVESTGPGPGVATRLGAIRAAVGEVAASQQGPGSALPEAGSDPTATPTWWGNGGWGRWRFGWGNGGFGWPNGWHNGWHNWGNGWNNWGNGWHNFWHNY